MIEMVKNLVSQTLGGMVMGAFALHLATFDQMTNALSDIEEIVHHDNK